MKPRIGYPQSIEDVAYLRERMAKIGPKPPTHIRNYPGRNTPGNKNKPLFFKHPKFVRDVAHRKLAYLMAKHRAKLDVMTPKQRARRYGLLCGLAVIMAKTELKMVASHKDRFMKGIYSRRLKSRIKTFLGLQEPYKGFRPNMGSQFWVAHTVAARKRKADAQALAG